MGEINPSTIEAALPFVGGVIGLLIGFGAIPSANTPWAEKTRKILRWGGPALIAFAFLLFMMGNTPESGQAETIVTGMKAKMTVPVRVDDDTRLDDVRAISDKEIGYFLTLTTVTKTQLTSNPLALQLESNLRAGACQNPDYVKLFKAGISLRVVYQTVDHAEVIQVALTPGDCGF